MSTHRHLTTRPGLSRREALLGAVASSLFGCPAGESPAPAAAPRPTPKLAAPGEISAAGSPHGLEVVTLGPLKPEEQGGRLIVLLHGWGAPGDDLVSLGRELARPGSRFLIPAAPLPEQGGGRAWWHLNAKDRPTRAESDQLPPGHQPHPQVTAARMAVQALVRDAKQRYAPASVALVGFSQGSMLALDVALALDPVIDRVAVLSGYLLMDSLPALHARAPGAPRPRVLVAHGRADPIVTFAGGQTIKSILEAREYSIDWVPFDGGHEIPPNVTARLRTFLFGEA